MIMEPLQKVIDEGLSDPPAKSVLTCGKVSGGVENVDQMFMGLMMAHKKHRGMNKSHNHKEKKKANIRRHEKWEREAAKVYNAKVQEQVAAENAYWAPTDREDEKFQ